MTRLNADQFTANVQDQINLFLLDKLALNVIKLILQSQGSDGGFFLLDKLSSLSWELTVLHAFR